jgi:ATP-binding cassette subfamily B protein
MQADPELPPARIALVRSLGFAYRVEPRLLVTTLAVQIGAFVPEALTALWLKFLASGVTRGSGSLIAWAAGGLALSGAAAWLLRVSGTRVGFLFRERVTVAIEAHIASLQAGVPSIEHHERPEYLDRLQILKDQAFLLNHLYGSLVGVAGAAARLGITVVLLATVHPVLIALVVCAVPTVATATWRAGVERLTEERAGPHRRLARHLFELGTTASPAKEIRVSGNERGVAKRRRDAWETWFASVSRARWSSAVWHATTWAFFGAAYVGAIVFIAVVRHGDAGDVLLVLAAGANISRYLGATAFEADFLRWCVDAAKRLVWLERFDASRRETGERPAPERLVHGIHVDNVSFRYPGTDAVVLDDVSLDLPAGSVVAFVGENGAGKTTLVKLLCRMYAPTQGTITADGVDLAAIAADAWRMRVAGAFQDFMRFEFAARATIGLGDVPRMDEAAAIDAAVDRGGARDVVAALRSGLDTQLGPTWDEGVELSFGQWQKLALARGFMRERPVLLVLDEPTAALDAETEHALFERFAAASRQTRDDGRITVLVSHRFSTVRMADLIVVIDKGRIAESGSHEELMARGGLYAELYGIQARAYR